MQQSLEASQGWNTIGFAANAPGRGCFLKISGKAEFDRAEVLFADGELRTLDLELTRRGKGTYELAQWEQSREIVCVRMRARACSARARVQLLLAR